MREAFAAFIFFNDAFRYVMFFVGLFSVFRLIRLQWITPEKLDIISVGVFEDWKKHYKRSLLLFIASGLGMFIFAIFIRLLNPVLNVNPEFLFGCFTITLGGCIFGVIDGSKDLRFKKSTKELILKISVINVIFVNRLPGLEISAVH